MPVNPSTIGLWVALLMNNAGALFTNIDIKGIFFKNIHFRITPIYTSRMDSFLRNSNNVILGECEFPGKTPLEDDHYLYERNVNKEQGGREPGIFSTYMTLTKVRDKTNILYYKAKVSLKHGERLINTLRDFLIRENNDTVYAFKIINIVAQPFIQSIELSYHTPFRYQVDTAEKILELYENSRFHNTAVILSGLPNAGKTYTLKVLKKMFDRRYPNKLVRYITNFDPRLIGNDITNLVLNFASAETPAIIFLDELQQTLKYVFEPRDNYAGDNRCRHANDIGSWNGFIDLIRDTPNVILVGATMESFDGLKQILRNGRENDDNESNLSMIRHGRFDGIITMTRDEDTNRGTMEYIENDIGVRN